MKPSLTKAVAGILISSTLMVGCSDNSERAEDGNDESSAAALTPIEQFVVADQGDLKRALDAQEHDSVRIGEARLSKPDGIFLKDNDVKQLTVELQNALRQTEQSAYVFGGCEGSATQFATKDVAQCNYLLDAAQDATVDFRFEPVRGGIELCKNDSEPGCEIRQTVRLHTNITQRSPLFIAKEKLGDNQVVNLLYREIRKGKDKDKVYVAFVLPKFNDTKAQTYLAKSLSLSDDGKMPIYWGAPVNNLYRLWAYVNSERGNVRVNEVGVSLALLTGTAVGLPAVTAAARTAWAAATVNLNLATFGALLMTNLAFVGSTTFAAAEFSKIVGIPEFVDSLPQQSPVRPVLATSLQVLNALPMLSLAGVGSGALVKAAAKQMTRAQLAADMAEFMRTNGLNPDQKKYLIGEVEKQVSNMGPNRFWAPITTSQLKPATETAYPTIVTIAGNQSNTANTEILLFKEALKTKSVVVTPKDALPLFVKQALNDNRVKGGVADLVRYATGLNVVSTQKFKSLIFVKGFRDESMLMLQLMLENGSGGVRIVTSALKGNLNSARMPQVGDALTDAEKVVQGMNLRVPSTWNKNCFESKKVFQEKNELANVMKDYFENMKTVFDKI